MPFLLLLVLALLSLQMSWPNSLGLSAGASALLTATGVVLLQIVAEIFVRRFRWEILRDPGQRYVLMRRAFTGLKIRHNLLLIVPPLILLLVQQTIFRVFPALSEDENPWILPSLGIGLLAVALLTIPWLLRLVLGLTPLEDGPLRQR